MKRVMLLMSLVFTLLGSTGCQHGLYHNNCNNCNGAVGCRPCRLAWQRGGTDYQRFLSHQGSYLHGNGGHGHHGGANGGAAQGPAAAQVAYPYYTTRGPRACRHDKPPTICS